VLFYHQPKTGDDVEHLHSTWLVFQGKVPYVDFFQHHNPLLWYLFAPLVGFFAYDITVFDVVRIISTLVMFASLFTAGLAVSRFVVKEKAALVLTAAAVFPSYIVFSGQDFRPDNYMVFCLLLAVYFLLSYLETPRTRALVLSFFWAVTSFFFMQKSIFMLGFFGLVVLFELYQKKISVADFMTACLVPLLMVLFFVGWLVKNDMVERYWQANYIFNLYIPDVYNGLVEPTKPEFYVLTVLALLGFGYFLKFGNKAARILCLFWAAEAIQRFFYFSLDRHYYYLLDILNGMMVGAFAAELIRRKAWTVWLFVGLSAAAMIPFADYCTKNILPPHYHRYVTPKYVVENTNRCDSVLNGYGLTYGIFTKDITYYWNLNGQLDVIGNKIGLAPLPDLNRAVRENLPKIIYTGFYLDEKKHKAGIDIPVHHIDPWIRDTFYEQSLFVDIFILKQEYQDRRRCRYDRATNTWNYFNKE
jgi:hypothetical protein